MSIVLLALLLQQATPTPGPGPTINMPMPDPKFISGKPLPAPDLPRGTVRVRVVRNDLSELVPGAPVELLGQGDTRSGKSDETGYARFDNLKREVVYRLRATIDGKRVESQPFQAPLQNGLKFVLVRAAADAPPAGAAPPQPRIEQEAAAPPINQLRGAPANPAESVPAGVVEVRLTGPTGTPLAGEKVTLASVGKDQQLHERELVSDANGRVRFDKIPPAPDVGHLVAMKHHGIAYNSMPFRMPDKPGLLVELRAYAKARELSKVIVGPQSHIAVELADRQLNVVENLVIENRGEAAYDPGPQGLFFALPAGFASAQVAEEAAPHTAIEKQGIYWKSALPPGRTTFRFGFLIPYESPDVTIRQTMPLAMDGVRVIVERTSGMSIDGPTALRREEREHQGRRFWLVGAQEMQSPSTPIELSLHGLPVTSRWGAWLALATSLAVAIWGFVSARRPPRRNPGSDRRKLEERRERLLADLVSLEEARRQGRADDPRSRERREELVSSLERVYRELDAA